MRAPLKPLASLALAAALAAALGACANTVSTAAFKGERHEVAQAISNLQADLTSGDQHKVCARDLSSSVVDRLETAPGGCAQVIKDQLAEIDSYELAVDSVKLARTGARRSASARVRSIYAGKTRASTLYLVLEGSSWKISGVG